MLTSPTMPRASDLPGSPEWRVDDRPVDYPNAVAAMEERVAAIREGRARELVWLLEHPPLYTAGTSADPAELVAPSRFPVYQTGRGGRWTYHGPGQRVAYVMLDLRARRLGVRDYVCALENWIITTLSGFGVRGGRRDGRIGIWVDRGHGREDKIAAVGVRVRRWVSFHGIAINVEPDLEHFGGIVPCGIAEHGVTSLADLGHLVTLPELDQALAATFDEAFPGSTHRDAFG